LIDEIDKAPRDFPNDLLSEIERMEFRLLELGAEVRAEPDWRPVVVITSNSERGLPDAFLRRCVYYDIPFPDRQRLEAILQLKLAQRYDREFAADALELLTVLRDDKLRLTKKPSTAELISWMLVLIAREAHVAKAGRTAPMANPLRDRSIATHTLGVLVKSREDLAQARRVCEVWATRRTS
jgi:MoxR-like ATPase